MKCVFSLSFDRNFVGLFYVIRPVVHFYMFRAITITLEHNVYIYQTSYVNHHQAV